jgi:hypothetical protein
MNKREAKLIALSNIMFAIDLESIEHDLLIEYGDNETEKIMEQCQLVLRKLRNERIKAAKHESEP